MIRLADDSHEVSDLVPLKKTYGKVRMSSATIELSALSFKTTVSLDCDNILFLMQEKGP